MNDDIENKSEEQTSFASSTCWDKSPLGKILDDGNFELEPGFEDRRIFRIKTINGCIYLLGCISDDGGLIDDNGDCMGFSFNEVDAWIYF